jgi:hypothetical protein
VYSLKEKDKLFESKLVLGPSSNSYCAIYYVYHSQLHSPFFFLKKLKKGRIHLSLVRIRNKRWKSIIEAGGRKINQQNENYNKFTRFSNHKLFRDLQRSESQDHMKESALKLKFKEVRKRLKSVQYLRTASIGRDCSFESDKTFSEKAFT